MKPKEKPRSMVTYDKAPPRWPQDKEKSIIRDDNNATGHGWVPFELMAEIYIKSMIVGPVLYEKTFKTVVCVNGFVCMIVRGL